MKKRKFFLVWIIIIFFVVIFFSIIHINNVYRTTKYVEELSGTEVCFQDYITYSSTYCYVYSDEYDNLYFINRNDGSLKLYEGKTKTEFISTEGTREEQSIHTINNFMPEFIKYGYETSTYSDERIIICQLNEDGRKTGNSIEFYFDEKNIIEIEVFNDDDIEKKLISEDEALAIAYLELEGIVEDINSVIDEAKYSEITGNIYFDLQSNHPKEIIVQFENLDYDILKKTEYEASIDNCESHIVKVDLLVYKQSIYYIVIIDNIENNLELAYNGENPVSKFFVKIDAYGGYPLKTAFEIISQPDLKHRDIYSYLP